MSASSSPTRRPRSRRPSAKLSAVVDLPTPPLPEATAITAAMPGISACRAIGEPAGLCGGRCDETGGTPRVPRGGAFGVRSAVSAIISVVTPGSARTALSACARTLSQARASAASTLMERNTLPSLTAIADRTSALVRATPRGDLTLASASRTCCCVTLKALLLPILSLGRQIRRIGRKEQLFPAPDLLRINQRAHAAVCAPRAARQ